MKIQSVESNGSITLSIEGEMENLSMKDMREALDRVINTSDLDLKVDFTNVEYIDSSGIGMLIYAYKSLKDQGRNFRLMNLSDRVAGILEMSSLSEVIAD